ncbi:MAG: YraN family protein [Burkholderiaceae bacterium]|nr:YraN family protein [Burkholderiaceae bacterium]
MTTGGSRTAREVKLTVRTPKQRAGDIAEEAAARHLLAAGYRIVQRNARYRDGEIDLVARDRDMVVFVEVRMRRDVRFGGAAASVDAYKQKRIARAAQHWLFANCGERWPVCRFDVVTVDGDGTIDWIRDAFQCN